MHAAPFPRPLIARYGRLSDDDRAVVAERRRPHTRLGFAYQLAFLRLSGRLPQQQPLERAPDLLRYVAEQLNIDLQEIERYVRRQPTISAHADAVASYLGYTAFSDQAREALIAALEGEVEHLEQPSALLGRAEEYLREQHVLRPARSALKRIAHEVRGAFRDRLYRQVDALLSAPLKSKLDALLETPGRYPSEAGSSPLQALREPPGIASPRAFNQEAQKLDVVDRTGIQQVDLSWIRESLRKALARRVRNSDAHRLRLLKAPHRYAALACFLQETRAEVIDGLIEMHGKIMTGTYRRAKNQLDDELKRHRRQVMATLRSFQAVARLLLDESVPDESLRAAIFSERSPEQLRKQLAEADAWLTGPKSDVFPYVRSRFSYLRQFAPALLNRLKLTATPSGHQDLVEAVGVLQELNETGRRALPADAPTSFLPKTTRRFVETDGGKLDRAGYECAVLTAIRDEIRRGNLFVEGSARYRPTDAFFMPKPEWDQVRSAFFARSGLPANAEEVTGHLQLRLEAAYDRFLTGLPRNAHVSVDPDGSWQLGSDSADPLTPDDKKRLGRLTSWLERRARRIRLPDLLIEVDNDLRFTRHLGPGRSRPRDAEHVCQAVAGVIAYGCNLGPVAMARLTKGVTYAQIKRIADWHLHEDALRSALGAVTDGIARLNTAKVWGEGKTSSSDGQRYIFPRKTVKRTYSHRLSDYALEFYSFIADNYAPFYGVPIECTERDAAYVLDGLLYHESDLAFL